MFKFVELIVLVLCVLRSTFAAPSGTSVSEEKVAGKPTEEKSSAPPTKLDLSRTNSGVRGLPYPSLGYQYLPFSSPYAQPYSHVHPQPYYFSPAINWKPSPIISSAPLSFPSVPFLPHKPISSVTPIIHEPAAIGSIASSAPIGHGTVSIPGISKPEISFSSHGEGQPLHVVSKQIIHKPVIINVEEIVRRPVVTEIRELIHKPVVAVLEQVIEKPLYVEHVQKVPSISTIKEDHYESPIYLKSDKIHHVASPPVTRLIQLPKLIARPSPSPISQGIPAISGGIGSLYGIGSGSAYGIGSGSTYGVGSGSAYGIGSGPAHGIGSGSAYGIGSGSAYGIGSGPAYGIGSGPAYGIGSGPAYGIGSGPAYGIGPGSTQGIPSYGFSSYGLGFHGYPSLVGEPSANSYLTPDFCKAGDCGKKQGKKIVLDTDDQWNSHSTDNSVSRGSSGKASEESIEQKLYSEFHRRLLEKLLKNSHEYLPKYVREVEKEMNVVAMNSNQMNTTSSPPTEEIKDVPMGSNETQFINIMEQLRSRILKLQKNLDEKNDSKNIPVVTNPVDELKYQTSSHF